MLNGKGKIRGHSFSFRAAINPLIAKITLCLDCNTSISFCVLKFFTFLDYSSPQPLSRHTCTACGTDSGRIVHCHCTGQMGIKYTWKGMVQGPIVHTDIIFQLSQLWNVQVIVKEVKLPGEISLHNSCTHYINRLVIISHYCYCFMHIMYFQDHSMEKTAYSIISILLLSRIWLVRIHGMDISMGNWKTTFILL